MNRILRGLIIDRFGSVVACERDTGISRTQLNRALSGKGITLDTARRIAEVLELTVDDLVGLVYDDQAERRAS